MLKRYKEYISVPFIILLCKMMTFVFDVTIGHYYGASIISDSFIMAYSLPLILFDGISTAIIVCFIPQFLEYKRIKDSESRDYMNNVILFAYIIGIIIAVILYVFSNRLMSLYAKGFSKEAILLSCKYLRILIWSIPFISLFSVFKAYLQLNNRKAVSNVSQFFVYSFMIVSIVFCYPNHISIAWAAVLGNAFSLIILFCISLKSGYRLNTDFNVRTRYIKTLVISMIPVIMSSMLGEINSFVDKYFTSFFSQGVVTDMTYGYRVSFAIQGIIASSIMIIYFPILSETYAKRECEKVKKVIVESFRITSILTYPVVFGGILLAYPIMSVIFGHGSFTDNNVQITSEVCSIYFLGVIPMSVKHIGDKICYSIHKTSITFVSSTVSVATNVILNYYLSRIYGYKGIAFSTVISIVLGLLVDYILIFKTERHLLTIDILKVLVKPLIPSIIMVSCIMLVSKVIPQSITYNEALYLVIRVIIGGLVYVISSVRFIDNRIRITF